jgi:hypothetical protein
MAYGECPGRQRRQQQQEVDFEIVAKKHASSFLEPQVTKAICK